MQKYCVLDDFLKGKMSELPPLYEARTFLIELTGITYYMEQPLENMLLPPDKTMSEWMKWFEDNQDKLYWDKNRKKVILKER